MFGWIPFIGPVINGVTSIFTKFLDNKAIIYQTDGKVDIAAMQAANNLTEASQDRIAIRILQDLLILPPVLWSAIIGWDTIVAFKYPNLMWIVPSYPPTLAYLPYMAFVYLLGATGLTIWGRK